MSRTRCVAVCVVAVLLVGSQGPAQVTGTTILTFDVGLPPQTPIPQTYGDNVQSVTQGGFGYGGSGLMTPDITVEYLAFPAPPAGDIHCHPGPTGDLTDFAKGTSNLTSARFRFSAGPGVNVVLNSMDLASFTFAAVIVPQINVIDATGATVWTQSNVAAGGSGGHLSLVFAPQPISPLLDLELILPSSGMWYIAADNLSFSQTGSTTGNGQANSAAASWQVNGLGALGVQGPFLVSVPVGGTLGFSWSGPPGGMIFVLAGPQNVGGLYVPGFGSVDIGTPPAYSDLTMVISGEDPAFPGFLFNLDPTGVAQQTFTVPFPAGVNLQAVIRDGSTGALALTAAFYISMF